MSFRATGKSCLRIPNSWPQLYSFPSDHISHLYHKPKKDKTFNWIWGVNWVINCLQNCIINELTGKALSQI